LFHLPINSVGKLFLNSPSGNDALPFDSMVFVAGLILWTVVGYLLMLCYRRYWTGEVYGKILLVGLPIIYFLLLEFAQLFITSRITDVNDVICGYLKGLRWEWCYNPLTFTIRLKVCQAELDLLKIPLLVYGVFILLAGLQPFDWHFSS